MANVIASISEPVITVTTTANPVTVSQDGAIISNVNITTQAVSVGSTEYTVNVSPLAAIGESTIREALSVVDTGGDGSLTYSNITGVFTYTGPNQTEANARIANAPSQVRAHINVNDLGGDGYLLYSPVTGIITYNGPNQIEANARIAAAPSQVRQHLSNTAPILYDSGTGVISIDDAALFSGKTTDDLAEGTVNKYFSNALARASLTGTGLVDYNPVTGVITLTDNQLITSVVAGAGLTGGATSGTATLNVGSGDGITVNADNIQVNSTVVRTTRNLTAGNGLTGGGTLAADRTFAVDDTVIRGGSATTVASAQNINGILQADEFRLDTQGLLNMINSNVEIYFSSPPPNNYKIEFDKAAPWVLADFTCNLNTTFNAQSVTFNGTDVDLNSSRLSVDNGNIDINNGSINLGANATITGYTPPANTTAPLVRHKEVKTNYLYMGVNSPTGTTPLNGPTSNSVVLTADITPTQNGNPAITISRGDANLWDTTVGYLNFTPVGQLVDTYNDQTLAGEKTFSDVLTAESLRVTGSGLQFNYGETNPITPTTTTISIDRATSGKGANVALQWQENFDRWKFTNDGSTYHNLQTTADTNAIITTYLGDNANSPFVFNGDLEVQGNIDYVNVVDLLVNDQSITLNYGNATARDAFVYVDRSGSALSNAYLKWNETADRWEVFDGSNTIVIGAQTVESVNGQTGVVVLDTDDIAEGVANLYYTDARANAAIDAYVTGSENIDVTSGVISLSNTLGNVNQITTESGTGFTITSRDGVTAQQQFAGTDVAVLSVDGDGYAVFPNNQFTTTARASYSGGANLTYFEWEGTVTSGDANITVSAIREGSADGAATVSDITVGYTLTGGASLIFPEDAYVTAIDAGNNIITMNKTAISSATVAYSDERQFTPGAVDTTTAQVVSLISELQQGSGSYTAIGQVNPRNYKYGYPQSGFSNTDFDIYAVGTSTDYVFDDVSAFTVARTSVTPANTVLKAPLGITIGENTDLTNRGENDPFNSFGLNVMWDGLSGSADSRYQSSILFKQYTDNSQQEVAVGSVGLAGGGPRLFFTSATGNSTDNPFDTYPRANQELGRISWWGTTGEQLTPSSYNVPGFISVAAADNWSTWGSGVAGNTNVYMGATSSGVNPDTYLSYKAGELYLGGGNSKPVTLAPAYNGSAQTPNFAYEGNPTKWAEANYANVDAPSGSKFTVTNGGSVDAGVVGDMELAIKRNDNSSTVDTSIRTFINSGAFVGPWNGQIGMTFQPEVGTSLNGKTVVMSPSGTITDSSTGNESALGGNSYQLVYVFNGGTYVFYRIFSGGVPVTYTSIGGTAPAEFSVTQTTSYVTETVSSGVTEYEWKFSLPEQSDTLLLQGNSSTIAFFDSKLNIGDESNASLNYSFPSTPGTDGQVLQLDANYDLQWATIAGTGTVTSVTAGDGLIISAGNTNINPTISVGSGFGITVNADNIEWNNASFAALTTDVITTANVQAQVITANSFVGDTFTGGTFSGDGSDLEDVRALTVEEKVINKSGGTLPKGTPVYATGGVTSDALWVDVCDASDPAKMPCIGVLATALDADEEGRAIIAGKIAQVDTSTFSAGDQIFIAVGGGYANTAPTGEGNIIQFLGTVTRVDATQGGGIVKLDAPRATPALDSGNIFIGNGSNQSVSESMNTAFYDNVVLGSNNLWLGSGGSSPTQTAAETVIEDNIHNASVRLQQFRETVEDTGNVSGAVTFNAANGSIFKATVTGDITSLDITGVQAGTSATIILTQGATPGTLTAGATWRWAGGTKTLSTSTGDVDIISVFNDGTNYYASLTTGYVA